ncbi:MAG: RluA family pseudouridine synthase [Phycisphaeraceae bacterium]
MAEHPSPAEHDPSDIEPEAAALDPEAAAVEQDEEGVEHLQFVPSKQAKLRLDRYLQNKLKSVSRNQIQKLIACEGVTVNGKAAKPSTTLRAGDVVDVILPPRPAKTLKPEPIPLDILYEDADLIVINKQAGLIVHPARGQLTGTLLNALAHRFQQQHDAAQRGEISHADGTIEGLSSLGAEDARPGVVHRLDRNTTGVMLVAKRDESHWLIARQFERRTTLKAYLALVHGQLPDSGGAIEQPIGKHPTVREAMAVRHDSSARHAVTLYRVRERYRGYCLVELELKTGRTHQIRVHLSYLGCPIVGDILYGGEPVGAREIEHPPHTAAAQPFLTYARPKDEGAKLEAQAAQREDVLIATPALHAALLGIKHPITNEPLRFTAPVPSPMRDVVAALRMHPEDGPVATEGYWVDLDKALPR